MSAPDNVHTARPWSKYLSTVDCLTPGLADDQRELRARLMLARDLALARMRDAPVDSWELWQCIHSIASRWVFVAASIDDLDNVRKSLVRVAFQANALDRRAYHEQV